MRTPAAETTAPTSETTPSTDTAAPTTETSGSTNAQTPETENSGASAWGCIKNTVSNVFTTVKNVVYSMGALVINTVKGIAERFMDKNDETAKTATTQVDRGAQASAALGTPTGGSTTSADYESDSM